MQKQSVDILLATYNGERFLTEQINSIISQTYDNWNLIIRDDGSTDNTVGLIKKFIDKYPSKIILVEDADKNLGPSGNFAVLLSHSTADYIMFCDQDDVWEPDKVEVVYNRIKAVEKELAESTPILVHTDLMVVGRELEIISPSMFRFQRLNPTSVELPELLVQNNVTGCTVLINKALKEIASPIPKNIIMHDWWLVLVAAAFGKIEFIDKSTIKYRQHGNNDTGAFSYSSKYFLNRLKNYQKMKDIVRKNFKQAEVFFDRYKTKLKPADYDQVESYISLQTESLPKKLEILNKYNYKKQGKIRDLGYKLIVLSSRKMKVD